MPRGPYERFLIQLIDILKYFFTQDLSKCTTGAFITAIFVLFAKVSSTLFGNLPKSSDILEILLPLFIILGFASHAMSGFYPTFCMSHSEKNLNHDLETREKAR